MPFSWIAFDDSIDTRLRYREKGSLGWTDSLVVAGKDTILNLFSACTSYEWQLASSCDTGWTDYTPIRNIRSLGCCEAPRELFIQKTDSNLSISWDQIFAADYYRFDYRAENTLPWISDSTIDTSLVLAGLSPCTSYEFRIWSICSRAPFDTLSEVVSTLGCGSCTDLQFCEARGTDVSLEWIDSLDIGTIQFQSAKTAAMAILPGQNFTLLIDSAYKVHLQPGYNGGTFTEKWRIWIDLNSNGVFDSTELLLDPEPRQGPVQDTLIIPAGTVEGTARMRVAMRWAGFDRLTVPEACGVYVEGEVEDFCVNLKVGSDTYCEMSSDGVGAEWIDAVEVDTSRVQTGLAASGYELIGEEVFVSREGDISLTLIPQSLIPRQGFWRIWGDWNQNGDFEESELWIDTFQVDLDTLRLQQALPSGAALGKTRMRIALRRDTLPVLCESFRFGEVEDYVLNISEGNSLDRLSAPAFKVYPNPASEAWIIEGRLSGKSIAEVYDLNGKKLHSQSFSGQRTRLDIKSLQKGIYLIRVANKMGETWKKAVKK